MNFPSGVNFKYASSATGLSPARPEVGQLFPPIHTKPLWSLAAIPASCALSVPVLNDRWSAKSTETTANDRLLHFMPQLPLGRKDDEFGTTSQVIIEVIASLRPHRERPRHRCAAEQRDERAARHSITS